MQKLIKFSRLVFLLSWFCVSRPAGVEPTVEGLVELSEGLMKPILKENWKDDCSLLVNLIDNDIKKIKKMSQEELAPIFDKLRGEGDLENIAMAFFFSDYFLLRKFLDTVIQFLEFDSDLIKALPKELPVTGDLTQEILEPSIESAFGLTKNPYILKDSIFKEKFKDSDVFPNLIMGIRDYLDRKGNALFKKALKDFQQKVNPPLVFSDDTLGCVLRYCGTPKTFYRLSNVSKRYREIARRNCELDIDHYYHTKEKSEEKSDDVESCYQGCVDLIKRCPRVKSLSFSSGFLSEMGVEQVKKLISLCPNLLSLDLKGACRDKYGMCFLTNKDLEEILKSRPLIEKLVLSSMWKETIDILAKKFTNLKHLEFDGYDLMDKELESLAQGCINLKFLEVHRCKELTDNALKSLSKYCSSLEWLILWDCNNFTDEGLPVLAAGCPRLRQLYVGEGNLTKNGIINLLNVAKNLRYLSLLNCKNITLEDKKEFEALRKDMSFSIYMHKD